MKAFESLRLATKSIIPVMIMAVMFVGILVFEYEQNRQIASDYSSIVDNDGAAALKMARFARSAATVPYIVYRLNAYACTKDDAADCKAANDQFKATVAQAFDRIDGAIRIDPDREAHGPAMADFKSRFMALVNELQKPLELGLVDDASGIKLLRALDPKFSKLIADVSAFNDKTAKENRSGSGPSG